MNRIVAITVCYNYSERFRRVLERLLQLQSIEHVVVVTGQSDIATIELCSTSRVTILLHDFRHEGAKFDKGCAVQKAQLACFQAFPDFWHLVMDADILLPENFDAVMQRVTLQPNVLYGVSSRKQFSCASHLRAGKPFVVDYSGGWMWLGFFQLYRFHGAKWTYEHSDSAAACDDKFRDKFRHRALLDLELCHLGAPGKNWDGIVKEDWTDD